MSSLCPSLVHHIFNQSNSKRLKIPRFGVNARHSSREALATCNREFSNIYFSTNHTPFNVWARYDDDNDNENMFITTDIYSISETNARHKYIGKSIKQ